MGGTKEHAGVVNTGREKTSPTPHAPRPIEPPAAAVPTRRREPHTRTINDDSVTLWSSSE
jgi:hypothetical protein